MGRPKGSTLSKEHKEKIQKSLIGKQPKAFSELKTRAAIKKYILNKSNRTCSECGNGETHNNKPLVLQMDHKDGNKFNNSENNLRLLCPNCHSQTPTWTGRTNKNKINTERRFYRLV